MAGLEAPQFVEKGPYHFKISEIRHNISYAQNWTQAREGAPECCSCMAGGLRNLRAEGSDAVCSAVRCTHGSVPRARSLPLALELPRCMR